MDQNSPPHARRALQRRRGASDVDYAVLAALVAIAVLGAVVLTGDRVRSLFATSETRVSDGIAGLPLPEPSPSGGPAQPSGQGAWSGDGAFTLTPSSTPQTRPFTLTNVGPGPLTGGPPEISGGAHAFQILSSDCPPSLPAGDSCEVLVQASASANGTATAFLSVPGQPDGLPLVRTATGFDPHLA
jgi:Flp pilus assembly pilin Flp